METEVNRIEYNKSEKNFGFKYREVTTTLSYSEQKLQLHTLTHNAIFFQLEGELVIHWGNQQQITVSPGEFYFLPRGASVSAYMVSDKIKYIAARLDHGLDENSTFRSLLKVANETTPFTFSTLKIKEPLQIFLDTVKYYITNGLNNHQLQNAKFLELYVLFKNCYTKEECLNLFYPALEKNSKFKTFILDNYHVSVSIEELAAKASMSRSTFDRTFKENFGMTPHKWIDIQTRIMILRKAAEPHVTVKDIMYEVEVYNSSQFTKLCKRLCGVTPSELIKAK